MGNTGEQEVFPLSFSDPACTGPPMHTHRASSGCVTCSAQVGRKDDWIHMTCCLCACDSTTEASQPYIATSLEGFASQTDPPLPKSRGLAASGAHQTVLSLTKGALLSSLAALCQDSEGLRAKMAPCLAAGHSRTQSDGSLGLSRALYLSQYLPSPLWGRERSAHFRSQLAKEH